MGGGAGASGSGSTPHGGAAGAANAGQPPAAEITLAGPSGELDCGSTFGLGVSVEGFLLEPPSGTNVEGRGRLGEHSHAPIVPTTETIIAITVESTERSRPSPLPYSQRPRSRLAATGNPQTSRPRRSRCSREGGAADGHAFLPLRGPDVAAGGLNLGADARAALVDVPTTSAECAGSGSKRIVVGDPARSLLFAKASALTIEGSVSCGDAMLPDSHPALRAEEVEAIRSWIAAGAAP